jgi:cysteine desulfurase family protein (TIGR01976 family)
MADHKTAPQHRVATVDEIREYFPALDRVWKGQPVAYFDGPGGTQIARPVVEAMNDYLYNHNANTHWEYPSSNETDEIIGRSREAVADFLNAEANEIVFGNNMTTLTFHLAWALGRQLQPGDEIVVTELDHHANSDTWRSMARDRGLTIRVLPFDITTGELELDKLADLLSSRTKLLAIGAASNILGTINDMERAVAMARDVGAYTFVDAVHFAAHELIDMKRIDCDFLACSAYKFYGPHIGILYGRNELLSHLDFPKIRPAPDNTPDRVETGTQNHEGIAGAGATVEFIASLARAGLRRENLQVVFAEFHRRQHEQIVRLWDGLNSIAGVRIYGPAPDRPRTSTISFNIDGVPSDAVARHLADLAIFVSDGDFYAQTVIERLGVKGVVRAGCACYTIPDEIERLIEGVRTVANGYYGPSEGDK